VWREFDRFRQMRGRVLPDWPEYCFCPLAGAYAVVSGGSDRQLPPEEAAEIAQLGALAAWRATQGVYRFDPDLFAELVWSELDGEIPSDVLYHPPEWCVYIEASLLGAVGFFAHLEVDANDGHEELRLVLDFGDRLLGVPIHLGGTLLDGLRAADREASAQLALATDRSAASETFGLAREAPSFAPLVNLFLYLCSAEPELSGPRPSAISLLFNARPGVKVQPPDRPTVVEVGYRLGAALRAARAARSSIPRPGTGPSPAAHVRRAHWHTYLVGPREEPRRELRWLSPMLVGAKGPEDLAPVVRPVK
jgi:hypothetical protein